MVESPGLLFFLRAKIIPLKQSLYQSQQMFAPRTSDIRLTANVSDKNQDFKGRVKAGYHQVNR
jgi:hypothetical protein